MPNPVQNSFIKYCIKCKEVKSGCSFNLNKTTKDGYSCYCRECNKDYNKRYKLNRIQKIKIKKDPLKKAKEDFERGYKLCTKCKLEKEIKNFRIIKAKTGVSTTSACIECMNLKHRETYKTEEYKIKDRIYREKYKNTEKGKATRKKSYLNQKVNNYHMIRMRNIIWRFIRSKGVHKDKNTEILLGYNKEEFKKKFPNIPKGYNIDHKIPVEWFEQHTPAHIVNHLNNLQLLTKLQNQSKLNRYCDIVSKDYYEISISWIKEKYKMRVLGNEGTIKK